MLRPSSSTATTRKTAIACELPAKKHRSDLHVGRIQGAAQQAPSEAVIVLRVEIGDEIDRLAKPGIMRGGRAHLAARRRARPAGAEPANRTRDRARRPQPARPPSRRHRRPRRSRRRGRCRGPRAGVRPDQIATDDSVEVDCQLPNHRGPPHRCLAGLSTGLETGPHRLDDTRIERGKHDVEVWRSVSRRELKPAARSTPQLATQIVRDYAADPDASRAPRHRHQGRRTRTGRRSRSRRMSPRTPRSFSRCRGCGDRHG